MAMLDFLGRDIGGYTTTGDTSAQGFEAGFGTGTVTPNTGITWGKFLQSMMQGQQSQQQQQSPLGSLIPTQDAFAGATQTYNINQPLQQPRQANDQGMGEIMKILAGVFGVGA